MKQLKFIFIFVFLSGMLFTVFQYLPLLEEEASGHKIELAKKGKQNDLGNGDPDSGDEDCDDNDYEEDLSYFYSAVYASYFTKKEGLFIRNSNFYKYLLEQKSTPPPKV